MMPTLPASLEELRYYNDFNGPEGWRDSLSNAGIKDTFTRSYYYDTYTQTL